MHPGLGCGLRAEREGVPLVTGVEQCWGEGRAQTSVHGVLPAEAERTLQGPAWVAHAGVAYLFGPGGEVRLKVQQRRGRWSRVNTFIHAPAEVAGRVLEIAFEHPAGRDATYHYVVVPGLAPGDVAAYRRDREPRVLANSEAVQAIAAGDRWWVVFWQAGAIDLGRAGRLRTDRPALVLLHRDGASWRVAVGNPTHAKESLVVTLERRDGTRAARFGFGPGGGAGAPQIGLLERA